MMKLIFRKGVFYPAPITGNINGGKKKKKENAIKFLVSRYEALKYRFNKSFRKKIYNCYISANTLSRKKIVFLA